MENKLSDLKKRLRGPVKHPQQSVTLRLEAADEIERLEAALLWIASCHELTHPQNMRGVAKEALAAEGRNHE